MKVKAYRLAGLVADQVDVRMSLIQVHNFATGTTKLADLSDAATLARKSHRLEEASNILSRLVKPIRLDLGINVSYVLVSRSQGGFDRTLQMWEGPPVAVYQRIKVMYAEGSYVDFVKSLRYFCTHCPLEATREKGICDVGLLRARALAKLGNTVSMCAAPVLRLGKLIVFLLLCLGFAVGKFSNER